MLRLLTGRNIHLLPALLRETGAALRAHDLPLTVVVPRQLTLETERALLDGLNLRGSFRLQVVYPERLCERIFDATGWPEGVRIDARGRVMLVRRALIEEKENLSLYRGAHDRMGFAERAAKQIEALRQAGLSPEELENIASSAAGSYRQKLFDLSALLGAYERDIAGRFQDGESEFLFAADRCNDAEFLKETCVWFYGFDSMPPTLHALIAALSAVCPSVGVFLPLCKDDDPDKDLFLPLKRSVDRLVLKAREKNAAVEYVHVMENDVRAESLKHLERALFTAACPAFSGEVGKDAVLFEAKNPLEEARLAAAWVRGLVMEKGLRWSDVRILTADVEAYARPIHEAFSGFGIPVYFASDRAASRHRLSECLLTALSLIEKNFRSEDILSYLAAGFTDLTADETDRLTNYINQYAVEGVSVTKELRRGPEAVREAVEPLREKALAPVMHLKAALKNAKALPEQLESVFAFLTEVKAYEKSLARRAELCERGLFTLAGEEGQVWNRILGTLDQMHALMGKDRLSLRALRQTLQESLDAATVKSLPQSGDAVYVQPWTHAAMTPARVVMVLGAVDKSGASAEGLFTDAQMRALSTATGRFVGLTAEESTRIRLMALKSAVGMATERLFVSYPLAANDDSALRAGLFVRQLRTVFPDMRVWTGRENHAVMRLLMSAPEAALDRVSLALSQSRPDETARRALFAVAKNESAQKKLRALAGSLSRKQALDSISPETSRELFGKISRASITRLERFAGCPFSHFLQYGLKPVVFEPYIFNPRDEGNFFHNAVYTFLSRCTRHDGVFSKDEAEREMDKIASALLEPLREGALGASAVALAEERRLRSVVRTAAAILADHLSKGDFRPVGLEIAFGREGPQIRVGERDDCVLEGRIDRVDMWEKVSSPDTEDGAGDVSGSAEASSGNAADSGEANKFVRVIDFKRGQKTLSGAELRAGLQLQLMIYLAEAMRMHKGRPAGVFYFRLDDALLETQETAPSLIELERAKKLRLRGLPSRDRDVLAAMAPKVTDVLDVSLTKTGDLYAGKGADEQDFALLMEHAVETAGKQVNDIRRGQASPTPLRTPDTDPCRYCDFSVACMHAGETSARQAEKISVSDLIELLRAKREAGANG